MLVQAVKMKNKSQNPLKLSSMQAARQDMRLVHVAVRAEGPTRVLCFSDSRGASLPGDEEETITRATAKLEGLQKHLQVCATSPSPHRQAHLSSPIHKDCLSNVPAGAGVPRSFASSG